MRFVFRLYSLPILMLCVCVFLMVRCFSKDVWGKTRFGTKVRLSNRSGRILCVVCTLLLLGLFVLKPAMDLPNLIRGDYTYAVVEMTEDYRSGSSNALNGKIAVVIHKEYRYLPETGEVEDSGKSAEGNEREVLYIPVTDYHYGSYYVVRYLPHSRYGEEVEKWKE